MVDGTPTETLYLEDLCQNKPERPGWSLVFGATCTEAASVCLEERSHPIEMMFHIDGIQSLNLELHRIEVDDTVRRFNADAEVATEYGAYGIAALLMPYLTKLTVIERSVKGKGFGFDFWLGSIDDPQTAFRKKARLEVSGIRQGSGSTLQSRVNMKLAQIGPSDSLSPGYVCAVEFGTPRARVVQKCRI